MTAVQYHRLAAGSSWWRAALGTAAILVGSILAQGPLLAAFVIPAHLAGRPEGADGLPSFGPLADLAFAFLTVATLLPLVYAATAVVQRRRPGTLSSVTGRLRWSRLLRCLPVAAAAVVVSLGGGYVVLRLTGADLGPAVPLVGWAPFLLSLAVLVVVVPLQAAAEEYVFRGWLLQAVGALVRRPWLPIAVQAVLFAAVHGWGTPWGFADLVVFGMLAGWLAVRTGGLEAAIALHVATNLVAGTLGALTGQLSLDETAADLPWQMVLVDVPVLVAYALVVAWMARVRPARPEEPAPEPVAEPAMSAGPGAHGR